MRLLIQRSLNSSVKVNNKIVGKINKGLVVFVSFTHLDNKEIIDKLIDKLINLRIFDDSNGLMNLSLIDINGEILSISQFTLYANLEKGRRPSFDQAMKYENALELYEYFNQKLIEQNIRVAEGKYGESMKINIINNGPVTIILDSNTIDTQ